MGHSFVKSSARSSVNQVHEGAQSASSHVGHWWWTPAGCGLCRSFGRAQTAWPGASRSCSLHRIVSGAAGHAVYRQAQLRPRAASQRACKAGVAGGGAGAHSLRQLYFAQAAALDKWRAKRRSHIVGQRGRVAASLVRAQVEAENWQRPGTTLMEPRGHVQDAHGSDQESPSRRAARLSTASSQFGRGQPPHLGGWPMGVVPAWLAMPMTSPMKTHTGVDGGDHGERQVHGR